MSTGIVERTLPTAAAHRFAHHRSGHLTNTLIGRCCASQKPENCFRMPAPDHPAALRSVANHIHRGLKTDDLQFPRRFTLIGKTSRSVTVSLGRLFSEYAKLRQKLRPAPEQPCSMSLSHDFFSVLLFRDHPRKNPDGDRTAKCVTVFTTSWSPGQTSASVSRIWIGEVRVFRRSVPRCGTVRSVCRALKILSS